MYVASLDIGNTKSALSVIDCETYACGPMTVCQTVDLANLLNDMVARIGLEPPGPVALCSVVPSAKSVATAMLAKLGLDSVVLVPGAGAGLAIDYCVPEQLGADRFANAIFCSQRYPGETVVIVCAGTAVTVDCLRDGVVFAGGAIFPGLYLQGNALTERTAQLPAVDWTQPIPAVPCRTTPDCIHAGIVHGCAGAVEHMVAELQRTCDIDRTVVSGGAWPLLSPHVQGVFEHVEHMTLIGAALWYRQLLA